MDIRQRRRVERWLYSIPEAERELALKREILADVEYRMANPAVAATAYDRISVTCQPSGSAVERVVLDLPERAQFLRERITELQAKVDLFWQVLGELKGQGRLWRNGRFGELSGEIVRLKYYRGITPDCLIWQNYLWCTERTFYRDLIKALLYYGKQV
jgi:hypothetical protein